MGCSFETARQSCGIHEKFDTACHASIITPSSRTRNLNARGATEHHHQQLLENSTNCINNNSGNNNNNKTINNICNNYNPKPDKPNDDCQPQPKPAKSKKTTNNSHTTTNINTTATVYSSSNIFTCNNDSNSNNGYHGIWDELNTKKLNFYSLEAKEYINKHSFDSSSRGETGKEDISEEEEIYQESCVNCYPLACHNRICCRQENLIKGEIISHSRHCLDNQAKYFSSASSCNCIGNCACASNNGKAPCHCLASSYFCQKRKNTLRHDRPGEMQGHLDPNDARASKITDSLPKIYSTGGQCLQKTLFQARMALTSHMATLKDGLIQVGDNCATMVESLIHPTILSGQQQCWKYCRSNKINRQNNNTHNHSKNNDNNNNNDKSEPYRGYCQRKHHHHHHYNHPHQHPLTLKPDFNHPCSTSTNSSCSLHEAISSSKQHQQQGDNIKSNSNNAKNSSCNNCHSTTATSNPTQTAAAFNYIGHNYYHFLRNSINFYTAYTASVILVLCYLTTTTSAATPKSDATSLDKHPIFDESSSDKEILDLLLEQKRYDKRLLPPVHDEDFCCGLSSPDMATEQNTRRPHKRGTLNVNVTVLLLSLASPDESSLKYEVEFLLNQFWVDPRLQYGNKSHYDFLNALHHHDSIWTPDTYFSMHGDFKDPIIPMHFALRIFRNGTIMYSMRRHLILSCQGSLHIFPFDDPKCTFSMESISYEEPQIRYVWTNGEVTLLKSPSLTTLNAYLIKNQTTACEQHSWRGNYSCLQVDLTFTRDRAYYFTTVFIPGIILVTSSFITFWLEWNAVPARVMIGVTTMLNFFTTSNGFRSTLPVVSNLTAMNVWDGVCMCFIYASLLEFVCVNYMGRKRPQHNVVYRPGENPVTQRLPAVLSRIGVILASPLEIIEREFNAAMSSEKAAAGLSSAGTSMVTTPSPGSPQTESMHHTPYQRQYSGGGIIASAVQNLRARSIKRRHVKDGEWRDPDISLDQNNGVVYEHIYAEPGGVTTFSAVPTIKTTTVTIETDIDDVVEMPKLKRCHSMSTNTPPLISKGADLQDTAIPETSKHIAFQEDINVATVMKGQLETMQLRTPVKPPRRKSSRSTSPSNRSDDISTPGEKKRDTGGPNEIVACTTCGGNSGTPCTHSANNGCATETCFVQVRKKEPPHPIRIAKTIDVIARITFPTAYAIFLIFFFVHYKGFS
ncbi:pH-sensitive chloride channel 1 isoform X3 [Haematobia irritans]|uniref:pH-sensitive chloride channel 1 isoform X3 n=1 Tax=Haematobia irritans TaxID=7368 RepID=UPI003F4F9DC9